MRSRHSYVLKAAAAAVVVLGTSAGWAVQPAAADVPGGDGSAGPRVTAQIIGPTGSQPREINEGGVVIGGVSDAQSHTRSFVWRDGVLTYLPPIGSDIATYASGLNNSGEVAYWAIGGAASGAYLWHAGTSTRITDPDPALPPPETGHMNERGQILLSMPTSGGGREAAIWSGGRITPIDMVPVKLNNQGDAVGSTNLTQSFAGEAAVWHDGHVIRLGTAGGDFSRGVDINDRGDVVGVVGTGEADHLRVVLWRNGESIPIDPLPGTTDCSVGEDWTAAGVRVQHVMNERSQIVGQCWGPDRYGAFLWDNGRTTELSSLGGIGISTPYDINERGQVVGFSPRASDGTSEAVLWEQGRPIDLGAATGLERSQALRLNNQGQIAGIQVDGATGQSRAVLWTVR